MLNSLTHTRLNIRIRTKGLSGVIQMSKQPILWNECQAEDTVYLCFCFVLLVQRDRCHGSSLKNVRQQVSLDGCHVPAGTRTRGFGKEAGRRLVIIGGTLWKSLLCS